MNNACFGKTMENVRKYNDMQITNMEKLPDHVRKTKFKSFDPIEENLILVSNYKTNVVLKKPIYCGAKILDLSKLHMYKFLYDVLTPVFNDRIELLYTDTDSFILAIYTNDLVKEFIDNNLLQYMDTSDYPNDHPWKKYHPDPNFNKKVIGKFKDELNGSKMYKFVGLASKSYAFKCDYAKSPEHLKFEKTFKYDEELFELIKVREGFNKTIDEKNKIKGITKVASKTLNFEKYFNTLFNKENKLIEQTRITSKRHELYTVTEMKKGLSAYDDKVYICKDGIECRPWGHYLND